MATIDDINNSFAYDKQANYPSTLTQQGTQKRHPVNDGVSVTSMVKPETLDVDGKIKPIPATLSYADMYKRLNIYTPPTAEELEAERRKQKRDMTLAAIGNGLNAFHQAYANARGVKPIAENVSLTGKVRDRYEKLKKERDALSREYANGLLRATQMDQQQENWRDTFKYNKERDEKSDAWRKSEADRQQGNLDRQFNYQKGRDEKSDEFRQQQFEESKRQFNVSSSQAQQRINMESRRLSREMQKENVSFALGTGNGTISVPTSALNASNVAYVFSKLPEEVRATVNGDPIIKNGKQVTQRVKQADGSYINVPVYAKPTTDAMLIAIGSNIENAPAAQDALREIAGHKANVKKPNPMGGNEKKPNPMS